MRLRIRVHWYIIRVNCFVGWTTQTPGSTLQGPIFLSEPPTSLIFANTHGAFVPCTAFGRPAPVLEWIRRDGTLVEDIPGLLKIHANNTLEFLPFEEAQFNTDVHNQDYQCTATNEAGVIISRQMQIKSGMEKYQIADYFRGSKYLRYR